MIAYKNRVLKVYPTAYITWKNQIYVIVYELGKYSQVYSPNFDILNEPVDTEKEAWKQAWLTIQKRTISKLEE